MAETNTTVTRSAPMLGLFMLAMSHPRVRASLIQRIRENRLDLPFRYRAKLVSAERAVWALIRGEQQHRHAHTARTATRRRRRARAATGTSASGADPPGDAGDEDGLDRALLAHVRGARTTLPASSRLQQAWQFALGLDIVELEVLSDLAARREKWLTTGRRP